MNYKNIFFLWISLACTTVYAQESHSVVGVVLNEDNQPLDNVEVSIEDQKVVTNVHGFYQLFPSATGELTITFDHSHYQPLVLTEYIAADRVTEINVRMFFSDTELTPIVINNTQ